MKAGLALFLSLLTASAVTAQQQSPADSAQPSIQIVEGDGAINSIRLHRAHDPVVRVVNSRGEPLAGAMVTFLLPATGPSGSFGGNGLSLTVPTDTHGVAASRGLRPNGLAGTFQIRVTASWSGLPAVATIAQTNAAPATHASRSKMIVIIGVIAGAAVGGAAAAAGHSSNSSGNTTATSGSIVSGPPTIGPPK